MDAVNSKENAVAMLKRHDVQMVEVDPLKCTYIMAIVERFLTFGILDFDTEAQNASVSAIKTLINSIGGEYKKRINYAMDTGRTDRLDQIYISPFVRDIFNRLMSYISNLQAHGLAMQYTID